MVNKTLGWIKGAEVCPSGMSINFDEHRPSFNADGSKVFQLVSDLPLISGSYFMCVIEVNVKQLHELITTIK